jgi:hypothetical protein
LQDSARFVTADAEPMQHNQDCHGKCTRNRDVVEEKQVDVYSAEHQTSWTRVTQDLLSHQVITAGALKF